MAANLPNPYFLINPFMRREAVLSSKIEGTETSLTGLYRFEAQGKLFRDDDDTAAASSARADAREVHNYVEALEFALKRREELPVSLRLIRDVHARLLRGVRGETADPGRFRRVPNWVGPKGCPISEARYVPPPVPDMTERLNALEIYINAPPAGSMLVKLAMIHYQFEAIHPFLDGNGRLGRLLIPLLLVDWGVLPLPLLYLSAYLERQQDKYYGLLLGVSLRGEIREWLSFFLRGVVVQSADAVARAARLLELEKDWRARLTGTRKTSLGPRLVEHLSVAPFISIPAAAQALSVSYGAAKKLVDAAVKAKILREHGRMHPKYFVAKELLDVMNQDFAS